VIRVLLSLVLLILVYALVLASFDPWDLAVGAVISTLLLIWAGGCLFGERPAPLPDLPRRVVAFVPYLGAVIVDVLVGTWNVALVVLHIRPLRQVGLVAVPIEDRTPTGIAVSALAATLSPGAVFVDVDRDRQAMLFHILATDPTTFAAAQQQMYRRYQRHVFP
jgi:multicomponent Na+:H+ antiporter subunit E